MKNKIYEILVSIEGGKFVPFDYTEYWEKDARKEIQHLRKECDKKNYRFRLHYLETVETVVLVAR